MSLWLASSSAWGMLLMLSMASGSVALVLTKPWRVQAGTSSTSPLPTPTASASPRVKVPLPLWMMNRCHQA
ncbi:hypothetical protein D3C78_1921990 [compost metagenome]